MKQNLLTAITDSISEVLEKMFFMSLELATNVNPEAFWARLPGNLKTVRQAFDGPMEGVFYLTVPEDLLASMTQNFIGLPQADLTEQHLEGTLKEALNMIAGSTFSRHDHEAVFRLQPPETVCACQANDEAAAEDQQTHFVGIKTLQNRMALKLVYSAAS